MTNPEIHATYDTERRQKQNKNKKGMSNTESTKHPRVN